MRTELGFVHKEKHTGEEWYRLGTPEDVSEIAQKTREGDKVHWIPFEEAPQPVQEAHRENSIHGQN